MNIYADFYTFNLKFIAPNKSYKKLRKKLLTNANKYGIICKVFYFTSISDF